MDESQKEDVIIPEKFQKIVTEIEQMSVLDLNELVKVFEKKFGVSAVVLNDQPPSASGARIAARQMMPSTGAHIFNPSIAALVSIGTICVASSDCSRVNVRLRSMNAYILPAI